MSAHCKSSSIVTDLLAQTQYLFITRKKQLGIFSTTAYENLDSTGRENGDIHLRKVDNPTITKKFFEEFQKLEPRHILLDQTRKPSEEEVAELAQNLERNFGSIATEIDPDQDLLTIRGSFAHFILPENFVAHLRYSEDMNYMGADGTPGRATIRSLQLFDDAAKRSFVALLYVTTQETSTIAASVSSRDKAGDTIRTENLAPAATEHLAMILEEIAASAKDGRVFIPTEDEHIFKQSTAATAPQTATPLSDGALATIKAMLATNER